MDGHENIPRSGESSNWSMASIDSNNPNRDTLSRMMKAKNIESEANKARFALLKQQHLPLKIGPVSG